MTYDSDLITAAWIFAGSATGGFFFFATGISCRVAVIAVLRVEYGYGFQDPLAVMPVQGYAYLREQDETGKDV